MEGIAITPLRAVGNIYAAAESLNEHLVRRDNADIAEEFPGTVQRYTGKVIDVARELLAKADTCSPEEGRQIFIASIGHRAVGLAGIQRVDEVPEGISADAPVLTYFVCKPYRRRGIDSQALNTLLNFSDAFFGGHAWTRIKNANMASRDLVENRGLELHHTNDEYCYYVY